MLKAKSVVASIKSSFLVYSLSLSLFTLLRAFEYDSSSVVSSSSSSFHNDKSRCRRRVFGMRKEKNASSSSKRLSETTKR